MSTPDRHLFDLGTTPLHKGVTLIEASAGTGKTFTIAGLVVRLIVEHDLRIQEILVATYTVPATAELRSRIRQFLERARLAFERGEAEEEFLRELLKWHGECRREITLRLERAVRSFDEAPVFSLHGFCHRMLNDKAFESGVLFDAELVPDPSSLLQEVTDDFWRLQYYNTSPLFPALALREGFKPALFRKLLETVTRHPEIKTIPSPPESFEKIKAGLESSFESMRQLWASDGPTIRRLFSGEGGRWAKGNMHQGKPEKMALLLEGVHEALTLPVVTPSMLEGFEKINTSSLRRATLAKAATPEHPFFDQCERFIELQSHYGLSLQQAFLAWSENELARRKIQKNILGFDDLQTRLRDALRAEGGGKLAASIRGRFKAALIDEFQDTDPVQYEIFTRIYAEQEGHWLFFIGDPKQAIYAFRGADVFTYLEAARQAQHEFTLGTNRRSESNLVGAVNHLFSLNPNPFVVEGIGFHPVKADGRQDKAPLKLNGQQVAPFQLWLCNEPEPLSKDEAGAWIVRAVAREIARLLDGQATIGESRLKPEDIAVLVATHRQAEQVQEALHRLRIPNVLHSHDSVFHSAEAAELLRVLEAVTEPANEFKLRAALATEVMGVSGESLEQIMNEEGAWDDRLMAFQEFHESWSRDGFIRMFRHSMLREKIRARLLRLPDGERRLTNLLHLGELIHAAVIERRLGMTGTIKWLSDRIADAASPSEEQELRLEQDDNAVQIVTMHKSKGLEYRVVFCPFSWQGSDLHRNEIVTFHNPEDGLRLTQNIAADKNHPHGALARIEKLAEKVRLLYVALTRAKNRCYLVWGRFDGSETSAVNCLLNPPATSEPNIFEALAAHNAQLAQDTFAACANQVASATTGLIEAAPLPEASAPEFRPADETRKPLAARMFTGRIVQDWRIASFSSLTHGVEIEAPDYDADGEAKSPASAQALTGIHAFPRGVQAGNCIHALLEKLDFQAPAQLPSLVRETLELFGLAGPDREAALCDAVNTLLQVPLDAGHGPFTLAEIATANRLCELEFHFPISQISPSLLRDFFSRFGETLPETRFSETLGRLQFSPARGFLKGFIDLVFEHKGRFYIADWKSNWIGSSAEAYHAQAIEAEMARHHYRLQYHLYCIALHRFLHQRVPGYDCATQFGGVFYIFLRGVDPSQPELGIFRDRPEPEVILALEQLLCGGDEP